eukprot:447982-Amorphochlora_amoeboformis.AAC.1
MYHSNNFHPPLRSTLARDYRHGLTTGGRAWLRHLLNASRFYITMKLIATQRDLIENWYDEESVFDDLDICMRCVLGQTKRRLI